MTVRRTRPSTPTSRSWRARRPSSRPRPAGYTRYDYDLDGDGTYETSGGRSVRHTFPAGEQVIGVRATDAAGRTDTSRATVDVGNPYGPLLLWHPAIAYAGTPVRLSAEFRQYSGNPVLSWDADGDGDFDDGSTSTFDPSLVGTISHTYATPGVYQVRVRATVDGGRTQTAMRTIHVLDTPPVAPSFSRLHTWPVVTADRLSSLDIDADPDAALTFDLDGDGAFDDHPRATVSGWEYQFTRSATIAVKATSPNGAVAIRTADLTLLPGNLGPWVDITPRRLKAYDGNGVLFASDKDDPIALYHDSGADDLDYCCFPVWDADGDGEYDDGRDRPLYLVSRDRGAHDRGPRHRRVRRRRHRAPHLRHHRRAG